MRPAVVLALLLVLGPAVHACPWLVRHRPCSVVYAPHCYPPPVYRGRPVTVIRFIEVPPAPAPQPAARPADAAPEGWSHIRGRIVFDGDPLPKQQPIPNSNGALTEDWVVEPANRGVKNVVVWLAPEPSPAEWARLKAKGAERLREFPSFPDKNIYPSLARKQDRMVIIPEGPIAFVPRVVGVQAGSDVVFQNVSTRLDNVHWESRENGESNRAIPPFGGEHRMKGTKRERLPIAIDSNVHPWMKAYVRVFDHPYFAVTDPNGAFEIKFAPAGNLRLFVWQETMGYRNGAEGRFGEPIQVPSGRFELGEIKIKPSR